MSWVGTGAGVGPARAVGRGALRQELPLAGNVGMLPT